MPFGSLTGVRLQIGDRSTPEPVKAFLQAVQVEEIKLLLDYSYQQVLTQ